MEETKDLKKWLIILIVIDTIIFIFGLYNRIISAWVGLIFVVFTAITGMVLGEYVRRLKNGEENTDNYPEW